MFVIKILTLFIAVWFLPDVESRKFWTNYSIDATKYFRMPLLNKFDEFEGCMESYKDKAKYCYVRTALKPDSTSDMYAYIVEFSSKKKQHFRHDKLTRGVCINSCMELIHELGSSSEEYYVSPFELDYKINFDFIEFANATEDRKKFNKIVNQCINVELMTLHNLSGFSSIEYCRDKDVTLKIDWLDIFFIVAMTILILIICISSLHDEKIRLRMLQTSKIRVDADEHYKVEPRTMADKFMVAFSFRRNWFLLSSPTKNEMRDLRSISAVRIWTMISIIYGHCSWFSIAVPIQNPFYVENGYHLMKTMIVINGGNLVQSFFFISGFLNSVVLLAYVKKNNKKGLSLLFKTVIYRLVRFAPVLLFLVLLHATWLYRFNSGPFWDKFVFFERQSCRANMWTNLLFINNYVSGDLKCLVHTWFISADFHLSIIATGVLLLVVNYPKRGKFILFSFVFVSFTISFIHFFYHKLEPIVILSPETLRNQLITTSPYDRYFYDFHSPTHLNTGNYSIGLVIGYFYYHLKQSGYRHKQNIFFHTLWHLSWMSTFVLCFIGVYFYENDIEKGVWSALLGAFLKHIYGPVLGILLVGIFFRYGHFIPKMYNYGMYRVLARLSFSVYMVHVTVGSLIITGNNYPIEINDAMLNAFTGAVYMISHGAAVFLVLCIEIPAHVIYKTVLSEIIEKPKTVRNVGEGINNKGFETHQLPTKDSITKC